MRITRDDIARMAGVSAATVSYVLNGSNRVSEKTKRRIQKIIEEYDYRPDQIARSLAQKKTRQIGLIAGDLFGRFATDLIMEFEAVAAREGYCVNLCADSRHAAFYVDNAVSRRLDGVLAMVSPTQEHLPLLYGLTDYAVPVVISGDPMADPARVSLLEPDYTGGMEQLLTYLRDYGHRRIAFLSAFPPDLDLDVRAKAFLKTYDRLFLSDEKQLLFGTYPFEATVETGSALTERLLRQPEPVTAIVTTNDAMAVGCIETLLNRGIRVPEEISVMGIDNIPLGRHTPVPLTTLGFDKRQFAEEAFSLLCDGMKTGVPHSRTVPMYVTQRRSVTVPLSR